MIAPLEFLCYRSLLQNSRCNEFLEAVSTLTQEEELWPYLNSCVKTGVPPTHSDIVKSGSIARCLTRMTRFTYNQWYNSSHFAHVEILKADPLKKRVGMRCESYQARCRRWHCWFVSKRSFERLLDILAWQPASDSSERRQPYSDVLFTPCYFYTKVFTSTEILDREPASFINEGFWKHQMITYYEYQERLKQCCIRRTVLKRRHQPYSSSKPSAFINSKA